MSALTRTLAAADGDAPQEIGSPVPVRRLVVMAAIALLLGVFALLMVLPRLAPPLPNQGGERLAWFDPKLVRYVEVGPRDGAAYSFTRSRETWFLVRQDGAKTEVPSDRLDGFLQTLAGLTRLVVIDDPKLDYAEFGLAPPRAVITVRDGGKGFTIALGDRNPPLTALYVQVLPRSNIDLVGAVLLWEYDKLVALAKTQPVEPRERTDADEIR